MRINRSGVFAMVGLVMAALGGLGMYQAGKAAPTSVAVVNVERLMNASAEAKTRGETFDRWKAPLEKELQDLRTEYAEKKKALEMMPRTSKDYRGKAVEYKELEAKLDVKIKLYSGLAELEKSEMFRLMYDSVLQASQRVAKQDGWQLVLLDDRDIKVEPDLSPAQVGQVIQSKRVLFAVDGIDITDRVLTDMDNAWNAAAAKPASK